MTSKNKSKTDIYLYPHGIQGDTKIELANKFTANGRISTLYGSYHVTQHDMKFAEDMLETKINELMADETANKIHLVLVGFSPLVAVMYGYYVKNMDKLQGIVDAVYFIKEADNEWKQHVINVEGVIT